MAKKSRTPPPPRRVQAPRPRGPERRGLDPERMRTLLFVGGAGAGVVALIVVLVVVFARGGGGGGGAGDPDRIAGALRQAGCTITSVVADSAQHVAESERIKYATFPPTSGRHLGQSTFWGNYKQPVDVRQAVHNLEHGGIVIWYGPKLSADERQKLTDFYDESPNAILVSPVEDPAKLVKYPKHEPLGAKIALTAWTAKAGQAEEGKGVLAVCPRVDGKAFAAFRDEFRGKGPERFPVSDLVPGT